MKFRHAFILVLARMFRLRVLRSREHHFIDFGPAARETAGRLICIEEL